MLDRSDAVEDGHASDYRLLSVVYVRAPNYLLLPVRSLHHCLQGFASRRRQCPRIDLSKMPSRSQHSQTPFPSADLIWFQVNICSVRESDVYLMHRIRHSFGHVEGLLSRSVSQF